MDPDNYRGISLISCLYKLLTAILNKRIAAYCLENEILSKAQLGFVMGNRCSDGHFILHNLVKDYCHANGRWLYSYIIYIYYRIQIHRISDILFESLCVIILVVELGWFIFPVFVQFVLESVDGGCLDNIGRKTVPSSCVSIVE